MSVRVVVVDNHDSFVFTLVGYLRELGAGVEIVQSDAAPAPAAFLADHDAVLVSPGPGRPEEAGCSVEVVTEAARRRMPLLGVCLGHQAIGAAFGVRVGEAPELMHGMVSDAAHDGTGLFRGIPTPMTVGRYHSLALREEDLPEELVVTARTDTGTVMAIAHRHVPLWGVQFHPESVLTRGGYRLLANWLALCGDERAVAASDGLDPLANASYSPAQ